MDLLKSPLVRPLEAPFQSTLDELARARGWPTSADAARLGARVRRLSDAYNDVASASLRGDDLLSARLVFSFPRDVTKGAAAVRELCAPGVLDRALREGRPLRVLDVGAGLGAMARGVTRALAASGAGGRVVVDALDADGDALGLAVAIARARPREGELELELSPVRASVADAAFRGPYDVILLGQVLSELDRAASPEVRVASHASLVRRLAAELSEDGSLIVVEPALRDRTRHLHALRDAVVCDPESRLHVFAPCVHDHPCPALGDPEAWCHEDLDVDLPPWLVPVARVAGLRWQGLTFSYLVLRPAAPSARERRARRLRVVSAPIVTKGKRELFLCGAFEGCAAAARLRVTRLDRHRSPTNADWDAICRGDVVHIEPPLAATRPRVEGDSGVMREAAAGGSVDAPGRAR